MELSIPEEVFNFFAADPIGPMLTLSRAAEDPNCSVYSQLNLFLETIPADTVAATSDDSYFRQIWGSAGNIEREARKWIAERYLAEEVSRRRMQLLREECHTLRPTPYETSALAGLSVDSDHLVNLSEFEFDGSRLTRNGYAFTLLSTTCSPNSTYWLLNALYLEGLAKHASVRLDPFLFGPMETFPAMSYRMWMYGRPLDWERISNLRETHHGRWSPSSLSHQSEFTDFCWEPRDNEVHFVCEEVPMNSPDLVEPSRYLHAVYMPKLSTIEHLDGALRLFARDEIEHRHTLHVRNSGKLGIREKVFRTDEPVSTESFSSVVQAFYVWNEDVAKYFNDTLAKI